MFISRKKYNELTNKLDSMHKLLGDVLAHTGNVIDTNSELLQTCKDLVQMNKNILDEFGDTYKKLLDYITVLDSAVIVRGVDVDIPPSITVGAATDA